MVRIGRNLFASQSPMLTSALDSYYLDGVGKLAARALTCWKPHKVVCIRCREKRETWRRMGHLRCLLGNTSPQGLGKFCVGTGDAHGLQPEASKRAEQGTRRIKISTDKFGAEIYFLPHLRLGRNHHHSANKDYQPRQSEVYVSNSCNITVNSRKLIRKGTSRSLPGHPPSELSSVFPK